MTNLKAVLGVLLGILVVLVVVSQLTGRKRLSTTEGGGFTELVSSTLDPETVQRIDAWIGSSPDSSVALERKSEGWVVASAWDWPAREQQIDRLLGDIVGLSGERRSSSADVFGDYAIGDDTGLHVAGKGAGGTELFHLIAGKNAQRGGSFVRTARSNDVAIVSAQLRSPFGIWGENVSPPKSQRWIDLTISKVDRENVDRLILRSGGREIVLVKDYRRVPVPPDTSAAEADTTWTDDRSSWSWKADEAGGILKQKADAILGLLANLNAADAVGPENLEAYGLTGPDARVAELILHDGAVDRILFGSVLPSDSTQVYVMKDGAKPAAVYKNTADRIFVERKTLSPGES